ncbi:uncharacterized protein H6S33_012450 [Morchella sextelata]|uniref:uncharacterized protein n=1 Tax=Morchella sextelata TaxID=1174677 RepID=UPI001D03F31E|nr:uncharacterized protein H6S33_012450 [Morchella sextelata]KAH0609904.1 hypothetical protein H6S33_012450 [Morchella sextelata]
MKRGESCICMFPEQMKYGTEVHIQQVALIMHPLTLARGCGRSPRCSTLPYLLYISTSYDLYLQATDVHYESCLAKGQMKDQSKGSNTSVIVNQILGPYITYEAHNIRI